MRKIDLEGWDWIAHPSGGSNDDASRKLVERRADILVLGEIEDENLSYEYDQFALISLDGEFYLLETSGCSCPDPTETWFVQEGPCSLSDIKEFMLSGKYEGYTLPAQLLKNFIDGIDNIRDDA